MKTEDLRKRYAQQLGSARARGVRWEFTFEQWLDVWGTAIEFRGRGHDKLCMQRIGDRGPYRIDNVRIDYPRQNVRTAVISKANRQAAKLRRKWLVVEAPDEDAKLERQFRGLRTSLD